MIESDLKTVDQVGVHGRSNLQDIENVKLTIESVTQLSILHPGYESLQILVAAQWKYNGFVVLIMDCCLH